MKRILVVEDEHAIREMIGFALKKAGLQFEEAADAEQALVAIVSNPPDLVVLDWMLPGLSGVDLARRLRREEVTAKLPVILLTARVEENDRVHGLEVGADDYITKPFSPRELLARINAVMRRSVPIDESGRLVIGVLTLDTVPRRILADGEEIAMGPTEYRLLEFFMSHAGRAFSRSQILDYVWGSNAYLEERTVDVHVRRLRKALEPARASHYLQTVRGHGYRFLVEG